MHINSSDYIALLSLVIAIASFVVSWQARRDGKAQWEETRKETVEFVADRRLGKELKFWRHGTKYGITVPYECTLINNSDRVVTVMDIKVSPQPDPPVQGPKVSGYHPPPLTPYQRNDPELPLQLGVGENVTFMHYQEYEIEGNVAKKVVFDSFDRPRDYASDQVVSFEQYSLLLFQTGVDFFGNAGSVVYDYEGQVLVGGGRFDPSTILQNPSFTMSFVTSRGGVLKFVTPFYAK